MGIVGTEPELAALPTFLTTQREWLDLLEGVRGWARLEEAADRLRALREDRRDDSENPAVGECQRDPDQGRERHRRTAPQPGVAFVGLEGDTGSAPHRTRLGHHLQVGARRVPTHPRSLRPGRDRRGEPAHRRGPAAASLPGQEGAGDRGPVPATAGQHAHRPGRPQDTGRPKAPFGRARRPLSHLHRLLRLPRRGLRAGRGRRRGPVARRALPVPPRHCRPREPAFLQ